MLRVVPAKRTTAPAEGDLTAEIMSGMESKSDVSDTERLGSSIEEGIDAIVKISV